MLTAGQVGLARAGAVLREVAFEPLRPASEALTRRWRALAGGRAGLLTCFLWAAGEATIWPIIPDFALLLLAFAAPRRAPRLLAATIAGAALGGSLTLLGSMAAPHAATALVMHVPLVHARSVPSVDAELGSHSVLASFLYQPWSGIPFKLWALRAGIAGFNPAAVIPCFVLGRSIRFTAAATLGVLFGLPIQRRLPAIALPLLLVLVPPVVYLFYAIAVVG